MLRVPPGGMKVSSLAVFQCATAWSFFAARGWAKARESSCSGTPSPRAVGPLRGAYRPLDLDRRGNLLRGRPLDLGLGPHPPPSTPATCSSRRSASSAPKGSAGPGRGPCPADAADRGREPRPRALNFGPNQKDSEHQGTNRRADRPGEPSGADDRLTDRRRAADPPGSATRTLPRPPRAGLSAGQRRVLPVGGVQSRRDRADHRRSPRRPI